MAISVGSASPSDRSAGPEHRSAPPGAVHEPACHRASAGLWAARARVAERAVFSRHLRPFLLLPRTILGRAHWPSTVVDELHIPFNYWWQAHLLDCLVDAELRDPAQRRRVVVGRVVRGIRLRNGGRWPNRYYDDMAWLGLALQRIEQAGMGREPALDVLAGQLRDAWTDHSGGGIWWRKDDDFKNVPANGPAAIFFARRGDQAGVERAVSTVDWIEQHLLDRATGLVWDGLRVGPDGGIRAIERAIYSYCQGVLLGACVELAVITGEDRWQAAAVGTIDAVGEHLTDGGVLRGHGGGDGGLFTGILLRYLADAACRLPATTAAALLSRQSAAGLVRSAAEAAWLNRAAVTGGPLFGADWTVPAAVPPARRLPGAAPVPERDFSVQLSGWMVLEAAARLERTPPP